jgi:putative copper resistance protein D
VSTPSPFSLLASHWTPSATVLVPAAAAAVLYVIGVRRAGAPWSVRRTVAFMAGVAALLVALQSGIGTYDDRLLSDHMIQHLLLLVVTPPLLLGGRPLTLVLRSMSPRRRGTLARLLRRAGMLTRPIPALALFTAVILLTHVPSFYDATLRHPALHDAEHVLYVAAGLLMFSPLLDGDPVPRHRLGGIGKLVYLILAMLPMALIGAYLNRHPMLFYSAYGPPARARGISALNDQSQAGAIMWVLGGSIMVAVGLWTAVAAMVAEERRLAAREARGAAVAVPDRGAPA